MSLGPFTFRPNILTIINVNERIDKTKVSYPCDVSTFVNQLRPADPSDYTQYPYYGTLLQVATAMAEDFIDADIAITNNVLTIDNYVGYDLVVKEGNIRKDVSINAVSCTISTNSSSNIPVQWNWIKYNNAYVSINQVITPDQLKIYYTTGYNLNDCPLPVKQAIYIKAVDLYDGERSSYIPGRIYNTQIFERLLTPYKKIQY
jgi:hypothetical protein